MHVYLRHANDNVRSKNKLYAHDHSLNSKSEVENDIIIFTQKLIKKYGYPDRIQCSPFKRARATLAVMLKVIDRKVKVIIEPKLSRFFTKKEQRKIGVRERTLRYQPPIYEDKQQFYKRVDQVKKENRCRCCTTWSITHYLVLKRMCEKESISIPDHMPFLWYTPI